MSLLNMQFHLTPAALLAMVFAGIGTVVCTIVLISRKKMMVSKHKVEAEAIVLSVNNTEYCSNDQLRLKLHMQVQPERGRNFVTEIQHTLPISMLTNIHAGLKLVVRFDPVNLKDIVIVHFHF